MELEMRLGELQQTRKDLMTELEELMKVLKVQPGPPATHQAAKFTQKISRNQTNISGQLRPYGASMPGVPLPGMVHAPGGHVTSYVRSPDTDINNSETDGASNSVNSVPASVNSLSE